MAENMLATEKMCVQQVVSEKTRQTVVRGKVSVPEFKPDVEQILSTDKTAKIKRLEIVPDKVIVDGKLTLQIVYVAFEPTQSVHHMHVQLPFTTFVDVPGARPGMKVQGRVAVEDMSVVRSQDDARQFDVAAVLSVYIKVSDIQEVEVLTQCPAGATCKTESIKIPHVVASNIKQIIVSDEFDIPREKPSAEKILDVMYDAEITGKRILKNKVIVDGAVTLQIVYVALKPDQPVHQMHRTFYFSDFIEVNGVLPDMDVNVDVTVESADVDQIGADHFKADAVLMLTANAMEIREVEVITEVSGAEAMMASLKVDHVIGEDSTQVVLRDVFQTPEPKPDVETVLETKVENVDIVETKILRNKVIIRGDVDVKVIYVAAMPKQPVHAMHRKIPFRTFVDIPGAEAGMEADVRTTAEFTTAGYESCHVTIELVLKINVRIYETMEKEVAVEVIVPTPPEVCVPGETIQHTIQSGDTFFQLAQRYGTTTEAIIQANPGVNPDQLQVGQVIQVPCAPAKG